VLSVQNCKLIIIATFIGLFCISETKTNFLSLNAVFVYLKLYFVANFWLLKCLFRIQGPTPDNVKVASRAVEKNHPALAAPSVRSFAVSESIDHPIKYSWNQQQPYSYSTLLPPRRALTFVVAQNIYLRPGRVLLQ
jgi:hypothetical protein